MRWGIVFAALICGVACYQQEAFLVQNPDADFYRLEVQPYLAPACASSSCHGRVQRPLRLYSAGGLRLDDATAASDPLSDDELQANMRALLGLDPERIGSVNHLVLTKPLSEKAGGVEHEEGEIIWASPEDPGYLCLSRWLMGDEGNETRQACAQAR